MQKKLGRKKWKGASPVISVLLMILLLLGIGTIVYVSLENFAQNKLTSADISHKVPDVQKETDNNERIDDSNIHRKKDPQILREFVGRYGKVMVASIAVICITIMILRYLIGKAPQC